MNCFHCIYFKQWLSMDGTFFAISSLLRNQHILSAEAGTRRFKQLINSSPIIFLHPPTEYALISEQILDSQLPSSFPSQWSIACISSWPKVSSGEFKSCVLPNLQFILIFIEILLNGFKRKSVLLVPPLELE